MNYLRSPVIVVVILAIVLQLSCMNVPVAPDKKPENAKITLFETGDCSSIDAGGTCRTGLVVQLGKHIDSITVYSSCGQEKLSLFPDHSKKFDTLYFEPLFYTEGPCTLFATAKLSDSNFADKKDKLVIDVYPPKAAVSFTEKPDFLVIHAGEMDTLLFVTGVSGNAILPVSYSIISEPALKTDFLYPVFSALRDTLLLVIDHPPADTYTITVEGLANVTSGEPVTDTAQVGLRVHPSLSPLVIEAPRTVFTGEKDTLIFTVQESGKTDTVFIQLVDEESLDPDIGTVISTPEDSLVIVLSPEKSGDLTLGVMITNGILSDTTWYPIAFMNRDSALWYQSETDVQCTEGTGVSLDLKEFFIQPGEDDVTFATDIGAVRDDTIWNWTPPWGTAVSLTATVTAQKGDLSIPLLIHLAVKPGDDDAPAIRLADKALDGKTVGSPQITVTCIATDEAAGVDKVYILFSGMATEAVLQNDSIYAGVVTGLVHNQPTKITLTASDRSIAKNSTTSSFTVTYDSTKQDDEAPVITYHSGPQSGDRVTGPEGTVIYIVNDPSGIDSVWWTLNNEYMDELSIDEDGKVELSYTLEEYGENVAAILATDDSNEHNRGSSSFTLHFNTTLSGISGTSPENTASDVRRTPTFTWSGGEDDDGDDVYFRVFYGLTNQTMTLSTGETRERTVTITSANSLTTSTEYFWQVIGYSKVFPDTQKSAIYTFTTRGGDADAPEMTQLSGPEDEARITSGSGTISLSITDASGVDSVYVIVDNGSRETVTGSDETYEYDYSFTQYGTHEIVFHAVDGASAHNRGAFTITVTYNTEVTSLSGFDPAEEAGNVDILPLLSWSGGTDSDGDSVYFSVSYGLSADDLEHSTGELTRRSYLFNSENQLNPLTTYYWQVTAWSKTYPDTVRSEVLSFSTFDPTAEDETGPTIAVQSGPDNGSTVTDAEATFTIRVTDLNDVDSVYASLNDGVKATLSSTGDTYTYSCSFTSGQNGIVFEAVDRSSNRNRSTLPINVTYDPTANDLDGPSISITSGPQNGSTVTEVSGMYSIEVTDASGVDTVYALLNNGSKSVLSSGGNNTYTYAYAFPTGQNSIVFEAVDNASRRNRSTLTVNVTFDPTADDEAGPAIAVETGPANGSTVSSGSGSFSLIVTDDSGVDSVYATLNNETKISLTSGGNNRYPFPYTFIEGDNNIVFEAVDNATGRNRSTLAVTVTYDPTADDETGPIISIESGPGNGTRITGEDVTFAIEVTDESGVDSVYATLNGGTQRVIVMTGTDTYDYQCTAVFGDNTVLFEAVDQASGRNRSNQSVTFNYNTTISAVTPSTPADNAADVATLPRFSWSGGNDPDGDDVFFRLSLGTSAGTYSIVINDITCTEYQLTSAHMLANSQTYYWMVTAYSGANSDETSSTERTFTTTAPTYSLIYDPNGGTGNVPTDDNGYRANDEAVVEGNTGSLSRSDRTFIGWNTEPDGSGSTYQEDEHVTFSSEDITLYAKWRMNENLLYASYTFSGNALDVSDNRHDAIVVGATLTEDRRGNPNSAYYFNGQALIHFENMSDFPSGNAPRTICGWFHSTHEDSSYMILFGFGYNTDQYNFQLGSGPASGGYDFRVNGWGDSYDWRTGISSADYLAGEWHHIAVTYDGSLTTTYIDGENLSETEDFQYLIDPDNARLVIGMEIDLYGWGFIGALDDIRIYTGALSADQILEIYNE